MGIFDEKVLKNTEPEQEQKEAKRVSEIDSWIRKREMVQEVIALIYGSDGQGKTGLALSYPLKEGEKMVVLDIDGGAAPIVKKFHKEKLEKGQILVKNPTVVNIDKLEVDYNETIKRIMGTIEWVRQNKDKENIRVFVLDGLSSTLKYCEYIMRLSLNAKVDDGINLRYWQRRNVVFSEIITTAKSLPIDIIFISHEDFILSEENSAAIKQFVNQSAFQKIRTERRVGIGSVEYVATVDKSKTKPLLDNKQYVFGVISGSAVKWRGEEVWKDFLEG